MPKFEELSFFLMLSPKIPGYLDEGIVAMVVSTEVKELWCSFSLQSLDYDWEALLLYFLQLHKSIKLVRIFWGFRRSFLETALFVFLLLFEIHFFLSLIRIFALEPRFLWNLLLNNLIKSKFMSDNWIKRKLMWRIQLKS